MVVALGAAFPPLLRWFALDTRRRGWRRWTLCVVSNTAFLFALRTTVLPRMKRFAERQQAFRDELGREPTQQEWLDFHKRDCAG